MVKTAVDYMRRYDPCFIWDIVEEIETQTVGKGEAIMTPALRSSLEEEREKGLLQGKQEGRMEGMSAGMEKGRQELILNMLKEKADLAFISKVTGLSVKKLKQFKNGDSE